MPWWSYLYIIVFLIATISGIRDDLKDSNKLLFVVGGALSAVFVTTFVITFFHPYLAIRLGDTLIVMIIIGVTYEITAAVRDIKQLKSDPELSETGNIIASFIGLILSALIILPGYLLGIMAFMNI